MGQKNFKPRHQNNSLSRAFNPRQKILNMYDVAWEKYRARFLKINSDCYACGKKATEVDHLIPHQGDEKLFKKLDNHIPLCVSCHSTVTSKFDRYYRPGNPVTEKIKFLSRNRFPTDTWIPTKVKVLASYL